MTESASLGAPWAVALRPVQDLVPGIVAAVTVALAASFLAQHYAGPVLLFALLLGMALNSLGNAESPCRPGVELAAGTLLRCAVALLGARITLEQIAGLGARTPVAVVALIAVTECAGLLLASALRLPRTLGILTGGAVSVCGASAAVAIAAVLPGGDDGERHLSFTIIGVTSLGTVAMILYPALAVLAGLDPAQTGFFFGAAIHDVAQVVGAGYGVSDQVGDMAAYTKLLRVTMLAPLVLIVAMFGGRGTNGGWLRGFPPFLIAFAAIATVNCADLIPPAVQQVLHTCSRWFLYVAIAAVGMRTSLGKIAALGIRPVVLICTETLVIGALARIVSRGLL